MQSDNRLTKFRFALTCLSTVLILQSCAVISGNPDQLPSSTNVAGKQSQEPRRSSSELTENDERTDADRNLILSEGYSQLYEAAQSLKFLDKALLLKVETDDFQEVAENIADYFSSLEKTLEQLNQDYPSLRLDNDGLPLLEKKTRSAAKKDRLASLAPITGVTGKEFERTMLLTFSGVLNQLRFLSMVMQEEEKSADRIALLTDIQANFDRLYNEVLDLLNARHFNQ